VEKIAEKRCKIWMKKWAKPRVETTTRDKSVQGRREKELKLDEEKRQVFGAK
jgi:hypothetical protein